MLVAKEVLLISSNAMPVAAGMIRTAATRIINMTCLAVFGKC